MKLSFSGVLPPYELKEVVSNEIATITWVLLMLYTKGKSTSFGKALQTIIVHYRQWISSKSFLSLEKQLSTIKEGCGRRVRSNHDSIEGTKSPLSILCLQNTQFSDFLKSNIISKMLIKGQSYHYSWME